MGGNVMGTALVMEHANALAQMIVSEKDKLFDERVEALVKLYRRAEFYLKQGFLESIVCEFHRFVRRSYASCEDTAGHYPASAYHVWGDKSDD